MVTLGEVRELEQRWIGNPNEISAPSVSELLLELYSALIKEQNLQEIRQGYDLPGDVPLGEDAEDIYRKLRGFLVQCRCL